MDVIDVGEIVRVKEDVTDDVVEICYECYDRIGWDYNMEEWAGAEMTVTREYPTILDCGAKAFFVKENGYCWTTHWVNQAVFSHPPDWKI